MDPIEPNPFVIVNFLAHGHTGGKWLTFTCSNHRSALLDLYDNSDVITSNPVFREFFMALNSQSLRSFDHSSYDISPIIDYFHSLGPNDSLDSIKLTRKLCWLLANGDRRLRSDDLFPL
ncbi:hypothetical protein CLU79DRAFT_836742 [Phycomyces nitens]|nr:hypothetical protein CLU79DRAFT_836742 [Phycomyces nitens]